MKIYVKEIHYRNRDGDWLQTVITSKRVIENYDYIVWREK